MNKKIKQIVSEKGKERINLVGYQKLIFTMKNL